MIPVPLIISAIQGLVAKKAVPAVISGVVRSHAKGSVMLKGKKTYIGIIVLAASFFAPQLGLTEGEVSEIVAHITAAVGGLLAIYGRAVAGK